LDGIILANKGTPVRIRFRNLLPPQNLIPVDTTIAGYPSGEAGFQTAKIKEILSLPTRS
jgi:hypothetical protein